MIDTSKGILPYQVGTYITTSLEVPQFLKKLWDFSKLEDQNMWNEDTQPEEVVSYIVKELLNKQPSECGIAIIDDEFFYAKMYSRDWTEKAVSLEWLMDYNQHMRLFKTLIGHLIQKGFGCLISYGMDEYIFEVAKDNRSYEDKEEREKTKEMLKETRKEIKFFKSCNEWANRISVEMLVPMIDRYKKHMPRHIQRWVDCAYGIITWADDLSTLSDAGYEAFDKEGEGKAGMDYNFIFYLGGPHLETEIWNYCSSTCNEVGYVPGVELSASGQFNDANKLYEQFLTINNACNSYN